MYLLADVHVCMDVKTHVNQRGRIVKNRREGEKERESERVSDRDCEMFAANSESFLGVCCWLIFFSFATGKVEYLCISYI